MLADLKRSEDLGWFALAKELPMKSLVDLLACLLEESGKRCGAPVDRDVNTLHSRVENEGDSFITITLPRFCRDFERGLDSGSVAPSAFSSFQKKKGRGIPAFMSGFLRNIFDSTGKLLAMPSVDCIRAIRQVCLFGKKVTRECSQERKRAATDAYVECDDQVREEHDLVSLQLFRYYLRVADIVVADLCLSGRRLWTMRPRHGRGATEDRLSRNARWAFRSWHRRLEQAGFTWSDFGRAQSTPPTDNVGDMTARMVEPWDEKPVRVVFVPKTATTPRVIAVEPACMQYAQQALRGVLTDALEESELTSGHVNFVSQEVNQHKAMDASRTGIYATLDMSEASDRVGMAHVRGMFRTVPAFLELLEACRSSRARLPNGHVKDLRKFASMGSAATFPVESLAFFISIIASRCLRSGKFPTRTLIAEMRKDVYVYGDDLIVPAGEAPAICEDLETLGFKVNRHKSFWTGKFRESCGVDAYAGESVTPVYLRHTCPADRTDASRIISWVATANQLAKAGYSVTSASMRKEVERHLGPLPWVPSGSPALGWEEHSKFRPPCRTNRELQRREYRCWVTVSPKEADACEGDAALAKMFWIMASRPSDQSIMKIAEIDPQHLVRSVTPYGVTLKRGWVSGEQIIHLSP